LGEIQDATTSRLWLIAETALCQTAPLPTIESTCIRPQGMPAWIFMLREVDLLALAPFAPARVVGSSPYNGVDTIGEIFK
jgi:hypothetical protein